MTPQSNMEVISLKEESSFPLIESSKILAGKTVLVVSADCPWPSNYSARIDVNDRIEILLALGLKVDLLATIGEHHASITHSNFEKVNHCYFVQRKSSLFDMIGSLEPGQVWSRRQLRSVRLVNEYDFVFLEGHYVAKILDNPSLKARHVILRVNNDERLYFWRLAFSKVGFSIVYYLIEALKFSWMWKKHLRDVNTWAFSSYDEYTKMIAYANKLSARSIFLPPHVQLSASSESTCKFGVLFIGTLLMPNNLQAVHWYLKNVHCLLLDIPNYHFTIAGKLNETSSDLDWVKEYPSVTLVPNPVNTSHLYSRAAVFVNPMRNGAGIKLKTIHALASGIPVVTTTVGAEGTRMRHGIEIYKTDDPHQFASYIRELLSSSSTRGLFALRAKKRLSSMYDQKSILKKLMLDLLLGDKKL